MDDIKISLGKRIRALRKQKGLSQEELGWKAELHFTYIGAVERGEKSCSIVTMEKIAKGLGVDIKDFFEIPSNELDGTKLRKEITNRLKSLSPQAIAVLKDIFKLLDVSK